MEQNNATQIYYFLFEAIPLADNLESKFCKGAFINCWIKSTQEELALQEAIDYIRHEEGWEVIRTEESFIANREGYEEDEQKDSLECFEWAVNHGVGVIVYTWSDDDGE